MFEFETSGRICADDEGNFSACVDEPLKRQNTQQVDLSPAGSAQHFVQINDYTKQLALELKSNMSGLSLTGSIIVLPFAYSGSNTADFSQLENDLAFGMQNDLTDFGIITADSSLAEYFQQAGSKQIEFSNEQQKVMNKFNVSYVLIGNISPRSNGLALNARVLELKSGKVIASGTKLLPSHLLAALI
ncbi:FlgO family outer membrane protein [Paraglaciecola aestuariivivens]